jgi:hypothetical protein
MRRRWKALVGLGVVALVAGLIFLLPPRDDGLDWIRAYGPVEKVQRMAIWQSGRGVAGSMEFDQHDFQFDRIPQEVIAKLKEEPFDRSDLPSRALVEVDVKSGTVTINRIRRPNWIERQWSALLRRLGWRST